MKRQFMPMNSEEDGQNGQQPQNPASRPSNLPHEASTPRSQTLAGKGLLSGWKSEDLPHQNVYAPTASGTPRPLDQQIKFGPTTDPLTDYVNGSMPSAPWPQTGQGGPANYPFWDGPASIQQPIQSYGPSPAAFAPTSSPAPQYPGSPAVSNTPPWPSPQFPGPAPAAQPGATPYAGYAGGPPPPYQQRSTGNLSPMAMMQQQQPPRAPMPPNRHTKAPKKRRFPIWARVLVGVLVFFIITGSSAFAYYQIYYAPSLNRIVGQQFRIQNKDGDTTIQQDDTSGNILSGQRVNIVLLGSDNDGKGNNEHDGKPLAQTVIIVSIDPATKTADMISIPRDMQVTDKLTGAHEKLDWLFSEGFVGNTVSDKVATGAGRTIQDLEYNFGISIKYYAWVGLDGFIKVVDTAGGVDIDATHPVVDDNYPDDVNNNGDIYANKRLYIAPGPQHMDGIQALEYVRSRHADLVGDFGRSARQQQVLSQLKVKLATPEIIAKAPDLLSALTNAVQTNLQLTDIVAMANFARTLDLNKLNRLTLAPPTYAQPSGVDTNFLPKCDAIVPALSQIFGSQATCQPQTAIPGASGSNNTNGTDNANVSASPTPNPTKTPQATPSPTPKHGKPKGAILQAIPDLSQSGGIFASPPDQADGIHSILDLMFMTTFETWEGSQF